MSDNRRKSGLAERLAVELFVMFVTDVNVVLVAKTFLAQLVNVS